MSVGLNIQDPSTGTAMGVDANNNGKVNLPTNQSQAGYVSVQYEQDEGAITLARDLRVPSVSIDERLSVGLATIQTLYNFTANSQNTGDFLHQFSTMTMTQTGGFLNINPGLATASGNYASLQSQRYFPLQGQGELVVEVVGQASLSVAPANQILEIGLFKQTAGVAPADGVFIRGTSAGLVGVISYSGVETTTGVMIASSPANTNGSYQIRVNQRRVEFWLDGIKGGSIPVPAGQAVPYLTLSLPLCFMVRNAGTVTGGIVLKIGSANVLQSDLATNKPWSAQMAVQGNAYQGQEGDTMGSLAIYSNAALAAAAAITNTTAAAGNTGLGGVALVLPTLTAGTDGILFAYLNPAGSATQPPKTLVVTGVSIGSAVQVALTGGPLSLVFGVAFGSTALSLATTESASFATGTTKAPRRVPLGVQGYAAAAAAGVVAIDIDRSFVSPLVINPGEYFVITMRNVGTVTTAGALVIAACIDHYFE